MYSRITWCPRRATFSVRIERRSNSTVVAWATTQAVTSGRNAPKLWVSSNAKMIAVSGERIVPPMIAAIPISAHRPGSPSGTSAPNSAPIAPPMISSGASTPPEVPEPSAIDQISALTIARRITAPSAMFPPSSAPITS